MVAVTILLTTVVAVTSAVTAGQQQAFEARQRIAAGLAAQELMSRLIAEPYANLPTWDGHTEPVGKMTDLAGDPMPETLSAVGRSVEVSTVLKTLTPLDVRVRGREITVTSFDESGRVLSELVEFAPEPQA
jgi:hypothetical protein